MLRNDHYTIESLSDFLYHRSYYKLNDTNLSRETNTNIPQQITSAKKLEEDGTTMFLIAEKQQKTIFSFSLDSLIVTE